MNRSTFTKTALTAMAGVMALTAAASVPTLAAAQSGAYSQGGYYYDPCRRDTTSRATVGGLLGAALGAAIGSNVAGHHVRTEGAVLGAATGGVAGALIGRSQAACSSGPDRRAYYDNGYRYGDNGYSQGYYNNGYYAGRYSDEARYDPRYDRDDYAYDRYGSRYDVTDRRSDADGCTLAESPIYLPDGRVQKRFVRVCRDESGRYQVVE